MLIFTPVIGIATYLFSRFALKKGHTYTLMATSASVAASEFAFALTFTETYKKLVNSSLNELGTELASNLPSVSEKLSPRAIGSILSHLSLATSLAAAGVSTYLNRQYYMDRIRKNNDLLVLDTLLTKGQTPKDQKSNALYTIVEFLPVSTFALMNSIPCLPTGVAVVSSVIVAGSIFYSNISNFKMSFVEALSSDVIGYFALGALTAAASYSTHISSFCSEFTVLAPLLSVAASAASSYVLQSRCTNLKEQAGIFLDNLSQETKKVDNDLQDPVSHANKLAIMGDDEDKTMQYECYLRKVQPKINLIADESIKKIGRYFSLIKICNKLIGNSDSVLSMAQNVGDDTLVEQLIELIQFTGSMTNKHMIANFCDNFTNQDGVRLDPEYMANIFKYFSKELNSASRELGI